MVPEVLLQVLFVPPALPVTVQANEPPSPVTVKILVVPSPGSVPNSIYKSFSTPPVGTTNSLSNEVAEAFLTPVIAKYSVPDVANAVEPMPPINIVLSAVVGVHVADQKASPTVGVFAGTTSRDISCPAVTETPSESVQVVAASETAHPKVIPAPA